MDIRSKNSIRMMKVIVMIGNEFMSIISSIASLKAWFLKLELKVVEIEVTVQSQILDTRGMTREKNVAKAKVSLIFANIAKGIMSYASDNGNGTLEGEVMYSYSVLKRKSDIELIEICNNILSIANDVLTELTDYAVTAAMLTEADTLKKDFAKLSTEVEKARDAKKMFTAKLKTLLGEARAILKNDMDRLVSLLAVEHTDFINLYKNSRGIDDYRGKKRKATPMSGIGILSGTVTDSNDSGAIEEATVTLVEADQTVTTDEDGAYYFEEVPAGVYTLKVSAETYVTEFVTDVEILPNSEVTEDVALNSDTDVTV